MAVQSKKQGNNWAGEKFNRKILELVKVLERLAEEEGDQFLDSIKSEEKHDSILGGCQVVGGFEGKVDRLIRLKEVLTLVPVGRSTWFAGVKSGRYPAPVKHLGPRISAWPLSLILKIVNNEVANEYE